VTGLRALAAPAAGRLALVAVAASLIAASSSLLGLTHCPLVVAFPAAYGYQYREILGEVVVSRHIPSQYYSGFIESLQDTLSSHGVMVRLLALKCPASRLLGLEPLLALLAVVVAYTGLRYLSGFEQALVMLTRRDLLAYLTTIALASEAPVLATLYAMHLSAPGPGLGGLKPLAALAVALLMYLLAFMAAFAATGSTTAPLLGTVLLALLLAVAGHPLSGLLWRRRMLAAALLALEAAALYKALGGGRLWLG
jgi:hypothetical protein